ncbi:MAG: DUF167 domain-containing protein [Candidatus Woesearchaeota archaeon]
MNLRQSFSSARSARQCGGIITDYPALENMDISERLVADLKSGKVKVVIRPKAVNTSIVSYNGESYKMDVKAAPVKGEANIELVKFVSRLVKQRVEIVSGLTSRTKILRFSR